MKVIYSLVLLFSVSTLFAQTPCENGEADGFGCNGYDLLSQIPLSTMNSVKANDSWGWTDPLDGKEYAIICLNEATAFIDISDPLNPNYLGQLPGNSPDHTTWRDAKTYNNHVFIVSEDSGHGMQVFDLTRLRDVVSPPVIFDEDAVYTAFGGSHNIAINEDTGFAYVIGASTFDGGPNFIDISDPVNPVSAGGFATEGYTHDAHIVIYDGPDPDYQGAEIFVGSNEDRIVIVDVTNKANPITISTIDYANVSYTHQGWLTEDHRFFILGDETDEIDTGINSRTLVFDFNDLDNPEFHFAYEGPSGATDHNGYVKGDKFYLANNAAGLRVVDISEIQSGTMIEEGFFDSYPTDNNAGFNGSWSVYPYFESGNIVISDRAQGMLLVRPSGTLGVEDFTENLNVSIAPNPATNFLEVSLNEGVISSTIIYDIHGRVVFSEADSDSTEKLIQISTLASGMYYLKLNNYSPVQFVKN